MPELHTAPALSRLCGIFFQQIFFANIFLARAVGVAVGRRSCIQRLHYPAFAVFF